MEIHPSRFVYIEILIDVGKPKSKFEFGFGYS